MIIVGIDPSFSCAGISVMDIESKRVRISDVRTKIGKKTYENIFWTSMKVEKGIRMIIDEVGDPTVIISEKPYHGGSFSSGMHTLDSIIFLNLMYKYKNLSKVYLITPRFLSHVHGQNGLKNYKKSDSTNLVRKGLIPVLRDYGWDIEYGSKFDEKKEFKGGLNNNTAESFIFLMRFFVKMSSLDEITIESRLLDDIFGVARGLFTEKEEVLFNKDDII